MAERKSAVNTSQAYVTPTIFRALRMACPRKFPQYDVRSAQPCAALQPWTAGWWSFPAWSWRRAGCAARIMQGNRDVMSNRAMGSIFVVVSAHLVGQQPTISLLPVTVRRRIDTGLTADLDHRCTFLALLQDKRFLRLRKPRCIHRSQLLSQPRKFSRKLQFQTIQFSGLRSPPFLSNCRLGMDQPSVTPRFAASPG